MTDEQTTTAIILTKHEGYVQASSIDLTEYGPLVVDQFSSVRLIPWHNVNDIAFLDEPNIPDPPPAIPAGHEGSE